MESVREYFHEKYCIDLGNREIVYKITYVALSRDRKFSQIGILSPFINTRIKIVNNNANT